MVEKRITPLDNISNLLNELNKLDIFSNNLNLIIFTSYWVKIDTPKNKNIKQDIRNIADLKDGKTTFMLKNKDEIVTSKVNNQTFIEADLMTLRKKYIRKYKVNILDVIKKISEVDFGKDKFFVNNNDLINIKRTPGINENDFKLRINKENNNIYVYILNKEVKKVDCEKIIKALNKKYANKWIIIETE